MEFLSTPSARRATSFRRSCIRRKVISIHALREEGDTCRDQYDELQRLFLSTPSARRATAWAVCILPLWAYFYPRPPRGGRLAACLR